MTLPADTDPMHKAVIAKLSGLSGTAFDKAYMGSQEKAHTDTVNLFEKEISMGKNAGLTRLRRRTCRRLKITPR